MSVKASDILAEYDKQKKTPVTEKKSAGVQSAQSILDEYDSTVKKKESGITEPASGSAPITSLLSDLAPEKTTVPTPVKKSFLDHDIELNGGASILRDPEANKPSAFSIRNIYYNQAKQEYDEEKELQKKDITSSPEKLADYTKKRLDASNVAIKGIKDRLRTSVNVPAYGGQGFNAMDQDSPDRKEIEDIEIYKRLLKSSVAEEAAKLIVPKHLADINTFDPKAVGRDIIKVADPEQELKYQDAERGGQSLPGIQSAYLERMGINAAKNFLNTNGNSEGSKEALKVIDDYEKDFDTRNFEMTAQRVREKIGAYFYKQGKSGFWGYSDKSIRNAINDPAVGLTDAEKKIALDYVLPIEDKLFFSTDIPGSGFFRSAKNAIDRSIVNAGHGISGKLTDWGIGAMRTNADVTQDLLNTEIEESKYRAPGENPSLKADLNYLVDKKEKQGLSESEERQLVDLKKYVNVRTGFAKLRDGMGDLTGQVLEMALLTKGTGLLGEGLSAVSKGGGLLSGGLTSGTFGTLLSNETVGLMVNSFLNSYDNYRMQAEDIMPGEKNAANRQAYAMVMGAVEGLSERIFPDTKILKAFSKEVAPTVMNITKKIVSGELTEELAKQEFQGTIKASLKTFGKEFLKSEFQESAEEGVVDVAQGIADSVFGGKDFDPVATGKKALNTFLTTALYSPIVSGMAAHGAHKQNNTQNAFMKSAIVDMGASPSAYLAAVEDLQLSGQITPKQANDKIAVIKGANTFLRELPNKKADGKDFDYPEVATYMLHRLNESILEKKIEATTDNLEQQRLNKDLKRSQEIRKGIFNGTIGVTPDMVEVTNEPEDAEEFGIADAETVRADELIGTPFSKQHAEPLSKEEIKDEGRLSPQETAVIEAIKNSQELAEKPEGSLGQIIHEAAKDPEKHQEVLDMLTAQLADPDALTDNVGEDIAVMAVKLGKQSEYASKEEVAAKDAGDKRERTVEDLPQVKYFTEFYSTPMDEGGKVMGAPEKLKLLKSDPVKFFEEQRDKKDYRGNDFYSEPQRAEFQNTINQINAIEKKEEDSGNLQSDDDIENRMVELEREISVGTTEGGKRNLKDEFNLLEKEMEKRERATVFDVPLGKVGEAVDALIKKDKEQPNGYGAFIERKDASETKAVAEKYLSAKDISDNEVKGDFKKALMGNPSTWYADGLLLRESMKEAANRGISIEDLLKEVESEFTKDGFTKEKAKRIIAKYLSPVFKSTENKNEKTETTELPESTKEEKRPDEAADKNIGTTEIRKEEKASESVKEKKGPHEERGFDESKGDEDVTGKTVDIPKEEPAKEKSIAEKGKELADRIRALKIKNDVLRSDIFGISTSLYNTSIDIVAYAVENGALLAEAIDRAVDYIKKNYGQSLDEEAYRNEIIDYANVSFKTKEEFADYLNRIYEYYTAGGKGNGRGYKLSEVRHAIAASDLSDEDISAVIRKSKLDSYTKKNVKENIAKRGKDLAYKIRQLKTPKDKLYSTVFGIPIAIYDGALETIATLVENGSRLADAINQAIKDVREEKFDRSGFRKAVEDMAEGKKPRLKFQLEGKDEEVEEEVERPEEEKPDHSAEPASIDKYSMTTSDSVNQYMSGVTIEDVFGEAPEGEQNYEVQRLSDMLQDGRNMIDIAMRKWGNDVMDYGKSLFEYVQSMSNDAELTNKKAVLLATFLGELKEAMLREPRRKSEIQPLNNAVENYYQQYMNIRGKEVVAGRLLRLYRDKYVGDLFIDRILSEKLAKARKTITEAERAKKIDDETAQRETKVTPEEKQTADQAEEKKYNEDKKKNKSKKSLKKEDAKREADAKLAEIKKAAGTKNDLVEKIKQTIKKLNCK